MQEIQCQFTTPEAAFIVYWCQKVTLDEKFEAWQEIIRTMPDCSMEKRVNMMQIDSFHVFLENYIALQKQDIQNFYAGDGCIYSYECHETENSFYDNWNDRWYGKFDLFFSDYASCMDDCRKKILADNNIDRIRVFKCLLNQTEELTRNNPDSILFNNKLEIMNVDVYHEEEYDDDLKLAFEGMCFDFPTPFKRGDILVQYAIDKTDRNRPLVLSYITTWNSKEMISRGFSEHECPFRGGWENYDRFVRKLLKTNDCSDMHAIGTIIWDGEETLDVDNTLIIPIDLEYYREPLKGMERQLQVVSCYEKGEVDISLLVNCCSAIRIEEYSKEIRSECIRPYTKEAMEQVGMISTDNRSVLED